MAPKKTAAAKPAAATARATATRRATAVKRPAAPKREAFDATSYKLTERQAIRLADTSGVEAAKLSGRTVGEIAKAYPFQIDRSMLFFRKVCGRVIQTDPVTGLERPVPYATVQVQDTDCSFLGYFPSGSPWTWFFPFNCHREVIATAHTDACGNFCVYVPRWDIDWILRWRLERECTPIIFERPNLGDLIEHVVPLPWPPEPIPGPDPGPIEGVRLPNLQHGAVREQLSHALGAAALTKLDALGGTRALGAKTAAANGAVRGPAHLSELSAPLPADLRLALSQSPEEATKILLARLNLDHTQLEDLDLRRAVGPFKRCTTKFVPEWTPVIDVPDLTFRVTQDIDGDGVEEQIYGESYFDVRWNSTSSAPVTLEAGPLARAGVPCGPTHVPCGDTPAIVLAGRLPVDAPPAFDPTTGYALLANRPHPTGLESDPLPSPQGQSPLEGLLSLYGCNETNPSDTLYRLVYEYSADGGATFGSERPFTGLTWPLYRLDGAGHGEWHYPSADANGWYPIALPAGPNPFLPQDLLLDWPTGGAYADGVYRVTLETKGAGPATRSATVAFVVDNSAPRASFGVEWSLSGTGGWQPLAGTCPVVRRGTAPSDVYFRVTFDVSAGHLRSAHMTPNDCGGGSMSFVSGTGGVQASPGAVTYEHWHTTVTDNSQTLQAIYLLPGSAAAEGTYGFSGVVSSRAFNPLDGGHLFTPPWQYDPSPITIYPSVAFSVINSPAI